MKKQFTQFLLVFIYVFMLSFVNAQSIVTTSDESSKGKCDGSAMISSMALPNLTSWVWKKDTTIIQKDGKDLVNLCGGKYKIQYVDKQNKTRIDSFFVNTKSSGGGTNACDGFKVFPSFVRPNVKDSSGKCTGRIELSVAGGHKPFVFTWTTISTNKTNSADALCGGNYGGYVKDSMGCTAQFNVAIKDTSLNNGGGTKACDGFKVFPSFVRPNVKDSTGKCTGRIELSVAGGHKPFVFTWTTISTNKTNSADALCGGNYGGYVKDSMGCTAQFNVAIKDTSFNNGGGTGGGTKACDGFKVFPSFVRPNVKDPSGKCTGRIELSVAGGHKPFVFTWTTISTNKTNSADALCGGNYGGYVKDSMGCTAQFNVAIKDTSLNNGGGTKACDGFKVFPSFVRPNVKDSTGKCTGRIELSVAGGHKPFVFTWTTISTNKTNSADALCGGNYGGYVKDSMGCTAQFNVAIKDTSLNNGGGTKACDGFKVFPSFVRPNVKDPSGKCTGRIELSVAGGHKPFVFTWTTISTNKTNSADALCGGNYGGYVKDSMGCTAQFNVAIKDTSLNNGGGTKACDGFKVFPSFVRPNVKDSSGKCTGRIELSVAGGHKPFVFTWTTISTNKTNSADALCGGNYGGYVKDSMGCTAQFNVAIKDTSLNNGGGTKACDGFKVFPSFVRPNVKDPSGKCTGRIELSVAGGHKPFVFTWTTISTNKTNSADALCGGNYGGYVKDSMGCTAQFNVAIKDTSLNNGGGSNGKPCQVELKGKSKDSTGLNFYLTLQTRVDNNGFVKSYELKIDGKVVSKDSTFIAKMTPGIHTIEYAITTSIGCEDRHIDTMSFPYFDEPKADCKNSNLKVALVKIENNKQGSTNCIGLIQVKATGGKSPYNFHWNNNITGEFAKGLCPGKYFVQLKDSHNCSVMASFEIKNDSVVGSNPCKEFKLELTKAINDKSGDTICSGLIDVHTVGGTAPFYFKWNNGVNTPYNQKLCAGTYTLNVKDANNCYASFTKSIFQDSVIVSNPCQGFKVELAKVQNTRKGETVCTGLIETRTYGGTAPYTYKWSNGRSTNVMDKLCEGKYTLLVTDKNNCSSELTAFVKADSIINSTTTSNCAGFIINVNGIKNSVKGATNCTGGIMTNASGGKQPYTFYWSNGTKDLFLSNVCAGTYTLKALDANGCLVSITKEVKADSASVNNDCTTLTANVLVKNTNASANACNGALEISVNGGTTPYAFAWNTSATGKAINGLCEGNYSVTITDAKKCAIKVNKYVGRDSIVQNPCAGFFANVNVKNDQDGDNVCSGVLLVNAGGGKSPYNYKWSDGSTQPYLKDVCKGSYAVSVFDANNCALTIEKYVGLDSVFNPCKNFYAKIAAVENCGLNAAKCNGVLKVAVAGGKAPYDFTWSNGVKAPSITDLCPNEYSVEIKDANKCAIVLTGKVSIDSTKNVCDGFFTKVVEVKNDKAGDNKCSGAIFTSTLGGKAPYAYFWSNGAKTANIIDVCSDKYFLYVKDANNCINQLDKFVGSDSIVDLCKGFNGYISSVKDYSADDTTCLGRLEATVKGGKAPFNFMWSNGDASITASNLCEGAYSLTITDANNCSITLNGKVRRLPSKTQKLKAFVKTTDVTASGVCDGTVNVTVVSGNAPYYFYHSNGEVSSNRIGVCAGIYTVIVKDAKNEVVELSYLISSPLNTLKNDKVKVPTGADPSVVDTIATSVTKDCSIDYNAIDSVKIAAYKLIAKDSLLVTWAIFSATKSTYVTDVYVFNAGKGVYKVNLELYCDEKKAIGNFLKASESFYYATQGSTAIVEKVTENVNVYPNPFSDKFTVKLEKVQDYQIHVMDMSGKALYTNSFANTNAINLDLGHLANGQYILKIVSETSSFSRMISK